jgi:hypothetical protein
MFGMFVCVCRRFLFGYATARKHVWPPNRGARNHCTHTKHQNRLHTCACPHTTHLHPATRIGGNSFCRQFLQLTRSNTYFMLILIVALNQSGLLGERTCASGFMFSKAINLRFCTVFLVIQNGEDESQSAQRLPRHDPR